MVPKGYPFDTPFLELPREGVYTRALLQIGHPLEGNEAHGVPTFGEPTHVREHLGATQGIQGSRIGEVEYAQPSDSVGCVIKSNLPPDASGGQPLDRVVPPRPGRSYNHCGISCRPESGLLAIESTMTMDVSQR